MATDSFNLGIPLPADSTKISEFPKVARAGLERVAALLSGDVTEATLDAIAGQLPPALAAEIAAADLLSGQDDRAPVLTDGDFRHAWTDPSGAMNLYDKATGEIVAPLGIDTPTAGTPTPADMPYVWIPVFDAATGTYPELLLGEDGCVPQWVLDRWKNRMGITSAPAPAPAPGGGATVGTRRAGVALTLSASNTTTDTATAVHLRHPFRIAADVRRFRIHLRNHNDRSNISYPGALNVTGIWAGRHAGAGQFEAAPVRLSGAFATDAAAAEHVTGWIAPETFQMDAYGEYLFSLGYTTAGQTNHAGQGGCWRSPAPAEASAAAPATALTRSQTSPLDIWVEVELSADVPVGAFLGDSLTCGTGATLPVYESYAAKHALAHGYVPQIMAHHGSKMTDWTNRNQWKWTKYAALDKPDSVLWALGGNDVFDGADLPALQARFAAMAKTVRAELSGLIFLANIMPRNRATTDPLEVTRRAYNDWLATLPERAVNVFDFAVTVAKPSATGYIEDAYNSGDNVHLNTAGYARNAVAITAPLAVVR